MLQEVPRNEPPCFFCVIQKRDTWEEALTGSSLPAGLHKGTTVETVQSAELSPVLLPKSNWKKIATERDLNIVDISEVELSVPSQKK